jgi:hypothetical protein
MIERARDQAMLALGPHYWTFFYILVMLGCMIIRHLLEKGVSERS